MLPINIWSSVDYAYTDRKENKKVYEDVGVLTCHRSEPLTREANFEC